MRQKECTRVEKHWEMLPREMADAPSLEHSRPGWMGLWAAWSGWSSPWSLQGWTRPPWKVSSSLNHSMIPLFNFSSLLEHWEPCNLWDPDPFGAVGALLNVPPSSFFSSHHPSLRAGDFSSLPPPLCQLTHTFETLLSISSVFSEPQDTFVNSPWCL